ncbi:MAG: phenylacetate--CoA ligase family protein [Sporichthyaceae bacterium]
MTADPNAAHARALLPALDAALDWTPEELRENRERRLRDLLQVALTRSPWHRRRMAGVDLDAPFEELLASLPTMTKADLAEHFDDTVTVPGIDRAAVESNIAGQPDAGYLNGEYTAIASSGSSGLRGIYVYDRTGFATYGLSHMRRRARTLRSAEPVVFAMVAAAHPTHASAALARSFPGFGMPVGSRTVLVPVTSPLAEQAAVLEAAQPDLLIGYPSALHRLAVEALGGRLHIAPQGVGCSGEPLLPETRAAIEAAWGVTPRNSWGASEGGALGDACALGSLHLSEDLHVVEPVDADGRPVPAGTEAAKVLLTNLYNHALPLIRYELTDQVRILPDPCACGSAHRVVDDLQGRLDEHFEYGAVSVHPHAIRSEIGRRAQVTEYQVQQTSDGIEVLLPSVEGLDVASLTEDLQLALRKAGLSDPQVTVSVVEALSRGLTGKLLRFVALKPVGNAR